MSVLDDDILGRKISTFDQQGLKIGAFNQQQLLATGFDAALMNEIAAADARLVELFSDGTGAAGSLFDPIAMPPGLAVPLLRFTHYYGQELGNPNNRNFHLFTDETGSDVERFIFAPEGWIGGQPQVNLDGAGNTFVVFQYKFTVGGATKSLQLTYVHPRVFDASGVSLEPITTDEDVPPRFPNGKKNAAFKFPRDASGNLIRNAKGSIAFGEIGGPGGFSPNPQRPYVHCHIKPRLSGVPRNPLESQLDVFRGMFP